ncbi:hypothetical protein AAF712_003265 [Marasmius tenuissimus]|uniref:F-box domain-containing protein n=1 Tax=Marasmius tenuissimus TaxID=585030 RepID=A0ABR3A8B4_9AGAR
MSVSAQNIVKQYLLDAETELKNYNLEVDRLKARIRALEHKRRILKENTTKYRSLLAPIHRMPPEVLAEIFDFCCEEDFICTDEDPTMITMTQVCGRWRQIGFATPRLWSTIRLEIGSWWFPDEEFPPERSRKRVKHMVELFTKCSKTVPLSLHLETLVNEDYAMLSDVQLVEALASLGCLPDNSARWRVLEINHTLLCRPKFQNIRGRLPKLARLVIHGESNGFGTGSPVFSDCPSLTSLHIQAAHWFTNDFPMHQLQSLILLNTYIAPVRRILRGCTTMSRLDLRWVGGFKDDPNPDKHDILPQVKSLLVTAEEEGEASDIFKVLTLRSLTTLEIRRSQTEGTEWESLDLGPLTDFLSRSSCMITSLTLDSLPLSNVEIGSLLRLTPTLTRLIVQESTQTGTGDKIIATSFLRPFSYLNIADPLLPALKDLSFIIHHHHTSNQELEALVDMIASRAPDCHDPAVTAVACLDSFTLVIMGEDEDEVDITVFSGPLQCFRATGLTIDISFREIDQSESD